MTKETLCWKCANACGGCSWSDHWEHSPIPGWKAIQVGMRLDNDKYGQSYVVEECPEFIPSKPRKTAKNCQKQG